MPVVCGSCDRVPPPGARPGQRCEGCGTQLVHVADEENLVGHVIDDRFEILAKLGEGGMGTVYRANQRSIDREVALKLVDRRLERDVAAVKRFLREAKLASQLAHPNTVGVIDFGQTADGRLYLAMELVRGRTLYDVLRVGGALPVARVARIGAQLVDALEAAHALSIVHRDLKPENVMLLDAPAGRDLVKVLDFGLARSFVDDEHRATATGVIAGTPRYLAPEVLDGAPPAPAQDLYALGVVLGELAIGGALWDAPTFDSLFARKLQGPPQSLDGVDPALRELVLKLLAIDPAARPPHAAIRTTLLALGDGAAPREPSRAPLTLEPTGELPPSAAFKPPAAGDAPLELEPEWLRAREAKQQAASARAPTPRRRGWLVAAVLLALAGAGVAGYVVTHPTKTAHR